MTSRWFVFCVAGLCWIRLAPADTLVLTNGEHVEGQIVEETPTDVSIRRAFKTGSIKYVDKISRTNIVRIERSATQPAASASAATAAPAASQPSAGEAEPPGGKIADKPTFLTGAIKKFQKPDYSAAGMDLSRLIVNSTSAELQGFSKTVEEALEMTLAETAAVAHFRAALDRAKGRAVQFQYVTEYEKPVLIPLIKEAYDQAVDTPVVAPGDAGEKGQGEAGRRPARSNDERRSSRRGQRSTPRAGREREQLPREHEQPAREREEENKSNGPDRDEKKPTSRPAMTIRSWLDHPEDFDGNRRECALMTIQVYHARSLLGEWQRLDPRVRTDVDLRAELAAERVKLEALLKSVKARGGGALTPQEQEALEAERRNRIEAAQGEQQRRERGVMEDIRRLMREQQRLNQPMQGAGPPTPTR